jgi:hypothetical protein
MARDATRRKPKPSVIQIFPCEYSPFCRGDVPRIVAGAAFNAYMLAVDHEACF